MTNEKGFRPRALGEIAIRCRDMSAMVRFYEDVIGLERLSGGLRSAITFFKIAEGFGGHTSVLALFQHGGTDPGDLIASSKDPPVSGAGSSLHHFALSLPFEEQDAVMRWYDKIGQPYRVELVAYDAAMLGDKVE